jgi:hypothetical protein
MPSACDGARDQKTRPNSARTLVAAANEAKNDVQRRQPTMKIGDFLLRRLKEASFDRQAMICE